MTTCTQHPTTGSGMEYVDAFPPEPASARRARRFVRAGLAEHGVASDAAELVVSELVANVAQHARTRVSVKLVVGPTLRLEVHDGNSVMPAMVEAAADAERGRGLFIIEALSRAWGIEPSPQGKRIWAEVPRDQD